MLIVTARLQCDLMTFFFSFSSCSGRDRLHFNLTANAPPLLRFVLCLCAIVGGVYTSAGKQALLDFSTSFESLMAGDDDNRARILRIALVASHFPMALSTTRSILWAAIQLKTSATQERSVFLVDVKSLILIGQRVARASRRFFMH